MCLRFDSQNNAFTFMPVIKAPKAGAFLICTTLLFSLPVRAGAPSASLYGPLGLNTVPSARMDKAGTIRAGVSTLDPYIHSWLSIQPAAPLSITLRQTAEVSNLNKKADRLYPGLDLKLRLMRETAHRPELAIGLQSATGHKRMAGEYLTASKRYNNFDFTAGLGWGRFGSAGHLKNPFKLLGGHFEKKRALDGEMPNRPDDWFTGENIGLFGGLEYFTPLKGLSLKLDYGADRYTAEKTAFNFNAPAPWSAGLNYQPAPWVDIALGIQGTNKVMGRITLQGLVQDWRDRDKGYTAPQYATPADMTINSETHTAAASAHLFTDISSPRQVGITARNIAAQTNTETRRIDITPRTLGLHGPTLHMLRDDLATHGGTTHSPEEIWHNTEFSTDTPPHPADTHFRFSDLLRNAFINLETRASLSEEDVGTLYRTSLIAGTRAPKFITALDNFMSLRLNLHDNLHNLDKIRPRALLPVRSDVDRFAGRTLALDTAYSTLTHSFRPELHMSLMGGYLEEMYAGAGGEVLYRPHDAHWAIGAESFFALKRDPASTLNLGLNGDHLLTGHINAWYDLPFWDLTMKAKFGRYLAEDTGGTLSVQKLFHNGAKLEGYITVTNQNDFDLFGGTTNADHGIRLSLPLGGFKHIPQNTRADFIAAPFGRDIGQSLHNPAPLYDLTENFSTRQMAEYWDDVVP